MGLRLRRGTNANRLLFIPVEGELLYVTDHTTANVSALWVGDGITLGGVPVDTDTDLNTQLDLATRSIADLGDVNVGVDSTVAENGDFLGYVEASGDWNPMKPTIGGAGDVNASGILDGEVLAWNFAGQDFRNTAMALNLLADVDITSTPPSAGQVLKWDSGDSKFKPADDTDTTLVLSGLSIGDLGDVNLQADGSTQPEHGDVIVFDSVSNTFVLGQNNSSIDQLSDVNLDGINQFDYLVWTGTRFDAFANPLLADGAIQKDTEGTHTGAVEGTTVNASAGFAGNLQGDANGDHTGTFTGAITATGSLNGTFAGSISATGTFQGDVSGSLFADDSSAIVDSIANTITTNEITTNEITVPTISNVDGEVNFEHTSDVSIVNLRRKQSGAHTSSSSIGRLRFSTVDTDTNIEKNQGAITVTGDSLLYIPSHDGVLQYEDYFKVHKTGKVAINMGQSEIPNEPSAALEVGGAIKPGVYADGPARDDAITSPVAGMIVFNTTGAKFQGYDGTAWVDLN